MSYLINKKGQIRVKEPKLSIKAWNVDPRRIAQDLSRKPR